MTMPPNDPAPESEQPKGPWLYSGAKQPTPAYVPPPATPATPTTPANAPPPPPPTAQVPATPPTSVPPPPPPARKPPPEKKQDPSLAGIVDTIEAIIIALILALTFRAFIVEAFVIPTGSMAPTLLGAHFKVICPVCGYEFDRNADLNYQYDPATNQIVKAPPRSELASNTDIPADDKGLPICPNCLSVIPYDAMPQYLGTHAVTQDANRGKMPGLVPFALANNGDRILVLKYLYSLLPPKRWDVIVFKEPLKAEDNYIKRLIGLPGETVEIVHGDVYIGPPGAPNDPAARQIARKPPSVQNAVWQLVYDNDFYPSDEGKPRIDGSVWTNPWHGETPGWDIHSPILTFAPPDGQNGGSLHFVARTPYGLNLLGYNNDIVDVRGAAWSGQTAPIMAVGDLHLETTWTPADDKPTIDLTLGLPANCFKAHWGPDGVTIFRVHPGLNADAVHPVAGPLPVPPPLKNKPVHVVFENVDRSARLFIDGKLVANYELPWSAADALHDGERDLPGSQVIRIEVSGASTLSHLKLLRDLYYTQSVDYPPSPNPRTANAGNPLTLGPDEFFPLGDNSRESSDGRYWSEVYPALDDLGTREGIVPRRYLLGKAFFVYWPAGYPVLNNLSLPGVPTLPIIPNTGDMRLIR
ncbi:MAG TPA: signal peptidase I [Phycisphaerae bacterium]|nr:signal peptidase I [Phycisphaerae bacterium]